MTYVALTLCFKLRSFFALFSVTSVVSSCTRQMQVAIVSIDADKSEVEVNKILLTH